jgi:hypothetical protein
MTGVVREVLGSESMTARIASMSDRTSKRVVLEIVRW